MTLPPAAEIKRIVYLGTPVTAVAPLRALKEAGYEIVLVVTRPDRRRGRGARLQPSPVKVAAQDLGITISDNLQALATVDADIAVVVAYGEIIPAPFLQRMPMVNMHFSLLPRWRGAAPVERAILNGDEVTGVCLMAVAEGLDTGPLYRQVRTKIDANEDSEMLQARLSALGTKLMLEAFSAGLGSPEPQQGEATYAAKLTSVDRHIDWRQSALQIIRQIRVGGAWTTFRGQRFIIWRAKQSEPVPKRGTPNLAPGSITELTVATGDGHIEMVEVQTQGRTRQSADAWRNGVRPRADDRFW
ncbi:MAG: methionyl-tRNA formyltransferase [Acidimicrobiia bacterium]|nr:methionyl-tRNA formyltransferase [Acidimicrobiia bacterium]MCY4457419.1 methionyl-tRNA formyltransferase [Acidimicrobiaceae bacterium]